MNLLNYLNVTRYLLNFALILQAIEIFSLTRNKNFYKIWNFENLKFNLYKSFLLPKFIIKPLFSNRFLIAISILQILISISSFYYIHPLFYLFLIFANLLIGIRFKGNFNGGSDMMTFVMLTGVCISISSSTDYGRKLGLIYICIHSFYSYFKAGLSKIITSDWKSGLALPTFLNRSLFRDMKKFAVFFTAQNSLSIFLSWLVILFEISIFLILFFPNLIWYYFALAVFFHFVVYLSFGLNRFFWIWLSSWPAIFYSIHLYR